MNKNLYNGVTGIPENLIQNLHKMPGNMYLPIFREKAD